MVSKQFTPKRLSQKQFLEAFRLVPRVAVNLVIKNSKGEILLTKRAIPPNKGSWHIPGSFLEKGERLLDCVKRIAKKELGIEINSNELEQLGVFEDLDQYPRGHVVDIIYGYKLNSQLPQKQTTESREIKFFSDIPKNLGFNHKDYLLNISKKWVR